MRTDIDPAVIASLDTPGTLVQIYMTLVLGSETLYLSSDEFEITPGVTTTPVVISWGDLNSLVNASRIYQLADSIGFESTISLVNNNTTGYIGQKFLSLVTWPENAQCGLYIRIGGDDVLIGNFILQDPIDVTPDGVTFSVVSIDQKNQLRVGTLAAGTYLNFAAGTVRNFPLTLDPSNSEPYAVVIEHDIDNNRLIFDRDVTSYYGIICRTNQLGLTIGPSGLGPDVANITGTHTTAVYNVRSNSLFWVDDPTKTFQYRIAVNPVTDISNYIVDSKRASNRDELFSETATAVTMTMAPLVYIDLSTTPDVVEVGGSAINNESLITSSGWNFIKTDFGGTIHGWDYIASVTTFISHQNNPWNDRILRFNPLNYIDIPERVYNCRGNFRLRYYQHWYDGDGVNWSDGWVTTVARVYGGTHTYSSYGSPVDVLLNGAFTNRDQLMGNPTYIDATMHGFSLLSGTYGNFPPYCMYGMFLITEFLITAEYDVPKDDCPYYYCGSPETYQAGATVTAPDVSNPADTLEWLLTRKGLAANIDTVSFTAARNWYTANSFRFDGVIEGETDVNTAIKDTLIQSRSFVINNGSVIKLKVLPDLASAVPVDTLSKYDYYIESYSFSRQPVTDIANVINIRYNDGGYDLSGRLMTLTHTVENSASIAQFGRYERTIDCNLISDPAVVSDLADYYLSVGAYPRMILSLDLRLSGIVYEIGDIIDVPLDAAGIGTVRGMILSSNFTFPAENQLSTFRMKIYCLELL